MSNNVENWLVSIFQPDYTCFCCASLFNRSPNWNFFHLIFCSVLHSLLRAIVLPVTYFWINTWSFLVAWVKLYSSIKSFVVRNYRFFHTFEKNILVTVKNWWSLTYGQVYIYLLINLYLNHLNCLPSCGFIQYSHHHTLVICRYFN